MHKRVARLGVVGKGPVEERGIVARGLVKAGQ